MDILSKNGELINDGDELVWCGRPDITGVVSTVCGIQGVKWSSNTYWVKNQAHWGGQFTITKKGWAVDYSEVSW